MAEKKVVYGSMTITKPDGSKETYGTAHREISQEGGKVVITRQDNGIVTIPAANEHVTLGG